MPSILFSLWFCLFLSVGSSRANQVVPWSSIIQHEPKAEGFLALCGMINLDGEACGQKMFGGRTSANGFPISGALAQQAAATCMKQHEEQLKAVESLQDMFDVDPIDMARYASGKLQPPNPVHDEEDGRHIRTHSKAAREEACQKCKDAYADQGIHASTKDGFLWTQGDVNDKTVKILEVGGLIGGAYGKVLAVFGMALEFAGSLTQNEIDKLNCATGAANPHEFDIEYDLDCGPAGYCRDSDGIPYYPSGAEIDKDDPNYPGKTDPNSSGSESGGSNENDNDDGSSDSSGTDSESPDGSEENVDVDTPDDVPEESSTPVLNDENVKNSMEKCMEIEERKLIELEGQITRDPNAVFLEDSRKQTAELQLAAGICDKYYYGPKFCQDHFSKLHTVPLTADDAEAMEILKQGYNFCPENVYAAEECNHIIAESKKRYVMDDETYSALAGFFKSGAPIPALPRVFNHFDTSELYRADRRPVQPAFTAGRVQISPNLSPSRPLSQAGHFPPVRSTWELQIPRKIGGKPVIAGGILLSGGEAGPGHSLDTLQPVIIGSPRFTPSELRNPGNMPMIPHDWDASHHDEL